MRKEPSLVLKSGVDDDGPMNTTVKTQKNHRVRAALRTMWQEQVAANRALLRINPSDERRTR
jgi:hypothetical protein